MYEPENPKPSFILALDRRYNTKSGKGRFCMTYYEEGKAPHEKTTGMIPWHVTNAHAYNPGRGTGSTSSGGSTGPRTSLVRGKPMTLRRRQLS